MTQFADRVFKNAKVYSIALDGTETRAEAVAVKDGKIVFVGSDAEAEKYIGGNTVVTDCEGNSLLPGFGDAHMHFSISVRRFGVIDLNDLVTDFNSQKPEDIVKIIQERVKAFADSHPEDEVLHGSGWERGWFEGNLGGITRLLTRHDIDAVVADRPVTLDSSCGHRCLLNTKALELAGLLGSASDPLGEMIQREGDGTPTGMIHETSAIVDVCNRIPGFEYSDRQYRQAMLDSQDFFASRGFTYLCDCLRNDGPYRVLKKMAEDGELKVRIDGVFNCKDATWEADMERAISEKDAFAVEDLFKVDTVKYFMDENIAMVEPYPDEFCDASGMPRGSGTGEGLLWDIGHYRASMEKAKQAGYNIHVHSYGDLATRETIDSMINAQKYDPERKLRDIIAHIFFIHDGDTERMADAGIIASIQPQWESANVKDCGPIQAMVGEDRFKGMYPNGSLARAGVRCANGSDFTVTMTNALEGISVAMTRKYPKNHKYYETYKDAPVLNPSEAATLKDSIMGWTINVAYQFGRENITGSIEVGKSAELVLLNGDIEHTPAEDICFLQVRETVFKGKTTYKA